jgi:hypothetical protein
VLFSTAMRSHTYQEEKMLPQSHQPENSLTVKKGKKVKELL